MSNLRFQTRYVYLVSSAVQFERGFDCTKLWQDCGSTKVVYVSLDMLGAYVVSMRDARAPPAFCQQVVRDHILLELGQDALFGTDAKSRL